MRPSLPRILIVDDQSANIDVLAEALGEAYELFAATTAERALELASAGIDLILLDVLMPGRNGFDVCRTLKALERTQKIPVIFVTALGDVEDEARGFEAGGVDYITKPISPPTVRARVRTHLELRGAQRRLEKEAEVLAENLRLKEHVERLSRHDLKTPLTSVISVPQILLEKGGLDEDQRGLLRSVEAAGYRILDLVNSSLDLYRMEAGTYEFQPARVDLREMAERVSLDLAALGREHGVCVRLPEKGSGAFARAEELLTYSMLANLIKNAIEASPRGETVDVEFASVNDTLRVAVRNSGVVPEPLRESFFRKYASRGKRSGTGLGTYSARLMAEAQRGRIEMQTSEIAGTVVTVILERDEGPVGAASRPLGMVAESSLTLPADARVLIVDDDEPTRFVLARHLGEGVRVFFATDGEAALREIRTFQPSIVFVDAEMPGADGFATIASLRALESSSGSSRRFLIGLSAHADERTHEAFLAAGADLVLAKPVTRSTIQAALEAASGARLPASTSAMRLPDHVTVDADLVPMLPAFLESRRDQARSLEVALRTSKFEEARKLAHKLRGGLEMCGFLEAGALSRTIEEGLACGQPAAAILGKAEALRAYLDEVRYEAGTKSEEKTR